MSAERIAQLESEIASLEAAQMKQIMGEVVTEVTFDGHTTKYTPTSLTGQPIENLIGAKRLELARLKGQGGPFGMRRS